MKFEELVEYKPKKVPGNFKDYTGFENEYFKVISRALTEKIIPRNGIVYVRLAVSIALKIVVI